jgi:hypothetical protein
MKRPIMIAIWSIAGLVLSSVVYGSILGILFFALAMAKVERLDLIATILGAYMGWVVPFAGLAYAAILGVRGKLPGTKPSR